MSHWHLVIIPCDLGSEIEVKWSTTDYETIMEFDKELQAEGISALGLEEDGNIGLVLARHCILIYLCPLEVEIPLICEAHAVEHDLHDVLRRWAKQHLAFALLSEAHGILAKKYQAEILKQLGGSSGKTKSKTARRR